MNDLLVVNLYLFILGVVNIIGVGVGVYLVVRIDHTAKLILRRQAFILHRSLEQYAGDITEEDIKSLELQKK